MKKNLLRSFKAILIVFVIVLGSVFSSMGQKAYAQTPTTFWKYQCIDTMKISRDNARSWAGKPDLEQHIAWEMQSIRSLGANCVAIATPYDAEFLPYLSKWVAGARRENLHIWFRGNFSGWEGWFDYPKITSTDKFLKNLNTFIVTNPQLFQDGDIFTGAPEAENGGPFHNVNPDEFDAYRKFLIDQYQTGQQAFKQLGKAVQLNWFSMNGGVAERMYDQKTLDSIGNLVTVDHYIKDATEMDTLIKLFKNTYDSKVMIGEFGAPIPDINGPMTQDQQATFTESVFKQLYKNRESVLGINYWDLSDGSTAIMNDDQTSRKVAEVIKRYFSPVVISGTVKDAQSKGLNKVQITTNDEQFTTMTDKTGMYTLPVATSSVTLTFRYDNKIATASANNLKPGDTVTKDITLTEENVCFFQKLGKFFQQLFC